MVYAKSFAKSKPAKNLKLRSLGLYDLVEITPSILARSESPFPTPLGTLDAIHLATALLLRDVVTDLKFATHDEQLATAAESMGFDLIV